MARAVTTQRKTINTIIAWAIGLLIFFPILWIFILSFKAEGDAIKTPIAVLTAPWTLENYGVVQERSDYAKHFFNSVILAFGSTILGLIVAVPAACTVPWVDDRSPLVAAQFTDRPTSSARSPAGTAAFAEFVRKLAVRPVDWLTTTGDVAAVSWLRYHGVKPSVPPEVVAVSQGAAPGPVLQPHQLLVAVTVPASTLRWSPLPSGALLPTISDLDRLTLLLPT